MTKYIKPETTVVTIENDRLLINFSNSYKPSGEGEGTRENLAKPNTDTDSWAKGGVW